MRKRRNTSSLGFTDLLFNALLSFAVMFILAFLLINPISKKGDVDNKAEFLITLSWPDGRSDDIDLYVEGPGGDLVWFRRREAGLMHLDRDDLGRRNDTMVVGGQRIINTLNQEIVSVRGIIAGEFVVNSHFYRKGNDGPVPITVVIEKLNPRVEIVYRSTEQLMRQGDEVTLVRFTVAGNGEVRGLSRLAKSIVPRRRADIPSGGSAS